MINFRKIEINDKTLYNKLLHEENTKSCQYGFSNLFMWGIQEIAYVHDHIANLTVIASIRFLLEQVIKRLYWMKFLQMQRNVVSALV